MTTSDVASPMMPAPQGAKSDISSIGCIDVNFTEGDLVTSLKETLKEGKLGQDDIDDTIQQLRECRVRTTRKASESYLIEKDGKGHSLKDYVGQFTLALQSKKRIRIKINPKTTLGLSLVHLLFMHLSTQGGPFQYRGRFKNEPMSYFVTELWAESLCEVLEGLPHLPQAFEEVREYSLFVRGKMLFTEQLKKGLDGTFPPFLSQFQRLTLDIPRNRVIKGALQQLLRKLVVVKERDQIIERRVRNALWKFSKVRDGESSEVLLHQAREVLRTSKIRDGRVRKAVQLSELILDNLAPAFLIGPTHAIFEHYCLHKLRKYLHERTQALEVEKQKYGNIVHFDQQDTLLSKQIQMEPDLLVKRKNKVILVGDCKYKDSIESRDVHQIISYSSMEHLSKAALIYAGKTCETSRMRIDVDLKVAKGLHETDPRLTVYVYNLGEIEPDCQALDSKLKEISDGIYELIKGGDSGNENVE